MLKSLLFSIVYLSLHFAVNAGVARIVPNAGLPDKCINSVSRDMNGLMWIGTKSGLCLYDGYGFLPIFSAHVLSNVSIQKLLYDDSNDLLWVATERGLYKVHCSSLKIEMVADGHKWAEQAVTDLLQHTNGHVFATYKSGQLLEITSHGKIVSTRVIEEAQLLATYPISMRRADDGLFFSLAGISTVFHFNVYTQIISKRTEEPLELGVYLNETTLSIHTNDTSITYPHPLKGDALAAFASTIKNLQNVKAILLPSPDIAYVICRPSLVYKLDYKKHSLELITSTEFNRRLITSAYMDPKHVIWLGTNKGLLKITPDYHRFSQHLIQPQSISVRSFVQDEHNNIYAGTYSGIYKADANLKQWTKTAGQIPFAMLDVPGKYIYMVEEQLQFHRIEKTTGIVSSDFYKQQQLSENRINKGYALEKDEHGNVWIGTNSGLVQFSPTTGIIAPLIIKNLSLKGVAIRNIRSLGKGRVVLSSDNGLYDINTVTGQNIHLNTTSQPALSANTVNFATEDKDGRLWICSEGGGINIWSKDKKTIAVLRTTDGLSDNITYNLIWKNEYAFISTYNGLSTYNLRDQTFYNFFVTDGLTENEFNRNAFLEEGKGKLFFGTINGINSFAPQQLMQSSAASSLLASVISKWDDEQHAYVNLAPAEVKHGIVMGPWDHSLTINLALSDYTSPERTVFTYRIKGLFDDWVNMYNQHSIQLNELSPGKYMVEVKALDAHGRAAANTLYLPIVVQQSFIQSVWFYVLLSLVALSIIGYLFRLRIKRLKELERLRQQISTDLHDEVGSLLTRITMTSDHMRYMSKEQDKSAPQLKKISQLSRMAVSSMNDILWAIDMRNDFTGNLADRLREYAEEVLNGLSTDIVFDISVAPKQPMPSQTRQEIYLIFKEAINNISKHSQPSQVAIVCYCRKQGLLLRITNNGVRPNSKASKGQGLRNMTMRAERLGAVAKIVQEEDNFVVEIYKH